MKALRCSLFALRRHPERSEGPPHGQPRVPASRRTGPAIAILLCALGAHAQIIRVRPRPNTYIPGAMTLTVTPANVNFTLVKAGIAPGQQTVTMNTSWTIGVNATAQLYAYFTSTSALTNGSDAITVGSVWGQCLTGTPTSFTPFTGTSPFATGTSLQIFSRYVTLSLFEQHTDTLSLQIDLTGQPQLPAATYTGNLTFQLTAF